MKFQVGDRVSVEAVVLDPYSGHLTCIQFDYGDEVDVPTAYVTLVERPKRKLRVGSVWERHSAAHPVQRYAWTGGDFVGCPGAFVIDRGDFDSHPERWREVPVEELEREAK